MTTADSEHIIAIDGLAILVHPSNPVDQLSIETLAKIFAGEITNWSAFGGPDLTIRVYARDDRSGTWDTLKDLVLTGKYMLTDKALRYESNDQLSDDISGDPAGIGFIGFAQSQTGQDIVAESGFFSQNPFAVDPVQDDSVPDTFKRLTEPYQRLSVNVRFAEGRTLLDNKAQRDLLRIQHYLGETGRTGKDLMLIGFADEQSDELRAQIISELRALSVSKALRERGTLVPGHTGYGHYMPVGAAGGDNGATRNGRVEVWVRR